MSGARGDAGGARVVGRRVVRLTRVALAVAAGPALLSGTAAAQAPEGPFPLEADVATLDGILSAYYAVVSHAAGEPMQVERDRSLHHPDARAIITGEGPDGTPFIRNRTLAEYHEAAAGSDAPFYEWEVARQTLRFGNMANVWSTYAWSDEPGGSVRGRGINNIQLYWDGSRWWITGWIFDSERANNPIPDAYLREEHP